MLKINYQNRVIPYNQTQINGESSVYFGAKQVMPVKHIGLSRDAQKRFRAFKDKYHHLENKRIQMAIKRGVDVVGGTVGIVLSAPFVLLASAAIKLESKGPALFKQKRIGKDGKVFTIYKLRTMTYKPCVKETSTEAGKVVMNSNDQRITRVGKFLRKWSIDELPQFINIVKGDMSLVGPRPCPLNYEKMYEEFDPDFVRRYAVKPGAQLKYPFLKDEDIAQKVSTEKEYVEQWSLVKDFKNLFAIVKQVFTGKNY